MVPAPVLSGFLLIEHAGAAQIAGRSGARENHSALPKDLGHRVAEMFDGLAVRAARGDD